MNPVSTALTGSALFAFLRASNDPAFAAIPARAAFNFAIARNRAAVLDASKAIETKVVPSDRLKTFYRERAAIDLEHAQRDAAGQPVPVGNGIAIDDVTKWRAARAEHDAANADAVAELAGLEAEQAKLLADAHDVRVIRVAAEQWPDGIPISVYGPLADVMLAIEEQPA